MSKIQLLTEQIYNKIAAGEVVERPASVLKELLENSLDAGALRIAVTIRKAGEQLISVVDDGEGMDPDDAILCFEAHATSKIKTEKDLYAISSFGFRGEAMPSIASVSKVTLRTRRRDTAEGFEVVINGGKMVSSAPFGCAPGTEVVVRDLFFNTPARRKFLRSQATEEKHISEMITNISLAHPEISFELTFDGRPFITSPAAKDLIPRIRELFGRDYADAMIPVSKSERGINVTGFIARRSFTRPTRLEQRVFVNGRPIESQAVYRGIREGCGPTLDKGRYQPCILFLSLNPALVDVNVHPAKREVRFSSDYEVTGAVRSAVGAALRAAETAIIDLGNYNAAAPAGSPDAGSVSPAPFPEIPAVPFEFHREPDFSGIDRVMANAFVDYTPSLLKPVLATAASLPGFATPQEERREELKLDRDEAPAVAEQAPSVEEKAEPLGLRLIGIFSDTYILAEKADGLILIDQHAAHERVLFERILKGVDGNLSQRLLIPVTIDLSRSDMVFLSKNAEFVEKVGYEIELFGQNTIKLNAIPAALSQDNAGNTFKDMLSRAIDSGSSATSRTDLETVAMSACKAAVKANDKLTVEEAVALLKQLTLCEQPFTCPHGRPTILNISTKEIERRFGRRG